MNTMNTPIYLEALFTDIRDNGKIFSNSSCKRLITNNTPYGRLQIALDNSVMQASTNDEMEQDPKRIPAHRAMQHIIDHENPEALFPTEDQIKIHRVAIEDDIHAQVVATLNDILRNPDTDTYKKLSPNIKEVLRKNAICICTVKPTIDANAKEAGELAQGCIHEMIHAANSTMYRIMHDNRLQIMMIGCNLTHVTSRQAQHLLHALPESIKGHTKDYEEDDIKVMYIESPHTQALDPRLRTPVVVVRKLDRQYDKKSYRKIR